MKPPRIVIKTCIQCNRLFETKKCWDHRVFCCSNKCAGLHRRKPPLIITCKYCKRDFISKRRKNATFCSRQCAQNIGLITLICLYCSKEFIRRNSYAQGHGAKYCSNQCRLNDWSQKSLTAGSAGNYQRNAWKVFERRCYDCGYSKHPKIIIIHHIDGNRDNGAITNLIPVCQNCHCLRHIALTGNHRLPSHRQNAA